MLPRRQRLTRRSFPGGRGASRTRGAHFLVSITKAPSGGAAAVVSKKTARLSTSRHLLKRRMLAVIRPFVRPGTALVVTALPGSASLPFSTLKTELNGLLERVFATL